MENKIFNICSILCMLYFVSCEESSKKISSNAKNSIDQIQDVIIAYELETDSIGIITDTLSIEKYKENSNGIKVYSELFLFQDFDILKRIEYFNEKGGVFYSKLESSNSGVLSIFEILDEKKTKKKAISVEYRDGKVFDTTYINYKFHYEVNRLKKLQVDATLNDTSYHFKTIIWYNDDEKPLKEIVLSKKDTMSVTTYHYLRGIITQRTIDDRKKNLLYLFKYDKNEGLQSEDVFIRQSDSLVINSHTDYETNKDGKIQKSTEIIYPSKAKRYIRFSYESSSN